MLSYVRVLLSNCCLSFRAPITLTFETLMSTTPQIGRLPTSGTAPDVVAFMKNFGLQHAPTFLPYQDFGYGAEWCHVSAKDRAIKGGGRRIHGWAVWQFNGIALADFHSVWQTPEGQLVDVTPPKYGTNQVLFVRDDNCKIEEEDGFYFLYVNRSSDAGNPFYWDGKPTQYTHWPLAPANPHLVQYCQKLSLPVSAILTDAVHG
jgi:hypothetical protein